MENEIRIAPARDGRCTEAEKAVVDVLIHKFGDLGWQAQIRWVGSEDPLGSRTLETRISIVCNVGFSILGGGAAFAMEKQGFLSMGERAIAMLSDALLGPEEHRKRLLGRLYGMLSGGRADLDAIREIEHLLIGGRALRKR